MTIQDAIKELRMTSFIPNYTGLPLTPYIRHKLRGTDGNGRPIEFTPEEKKELIAGLKKLGKELANVKE